ncbi:MAG: hypothetical protein KA035_03245 [Candidatus Levybacteria bacterium]|nr:hypothetical protein [Candidatus Levybacteria bacterium]
MLEVSMKFWNSKGFVWSPELGATIITVLVLVAIPTTLFLTQSRQDTRQQASGNAQTATISVDPPSGVYSVGQKFAVTLSVNGASQEFSSAKATVGTSSQLSIDSVTLTPVSAGGCNFSFTNPDTTPNSMNPSFYGILPNGNKTECTLYTIILTAVEAGQGSVYINDASIFNNTGSVNILGKTIPGVYTITP